MQVRRMKNRTPLIIVAWLLLMIGTWVIDAHGQQPTDARPQLGSAPTFRKTSRGCVFPSQPGPELQLPRPKAKPSLSIGEQGGSPYLFLTHYQNAATPAHGWTCNRTTCDAGTTSAVFRDAVLLRINYFRAMGGRARPGHSRGRLQREGPAGRADNERQRPTQPQSADHLAVLFSRRRGGGREVGSLPRRVRVGRDHGVHSRSRQQQRPGRPSPLAPLPPDAEHGNGRHPSDGGRAANALWVFDSHLGEARPPTRDTFVRGPRRLRAVSGGLPTLVVFLPGGGLLTGVGRGVRGTGRASRCARRPW